MLDHIAELKQQRESIIGAFRQIRSQGVQKPASRELLMSTIEQLIIHLEDQKNRFYPSVLGLLDIEDDTEKVIRIYDHEINLIKEEAIRMANRLMCTNNEVEFLRDFKIFLTGLQLRFLREEQQVFARIEELLTRRYVHIQSH